jgi:O-antigen/teichoic acid export membrane protein
MAPDPLTSPGEPESLLSISEDRTTDALPRHELKRRASAGIFIVFTRGVAIALLGFGGNVVLARLLSPHAFGVVAIGMAVVLFSSLLADGGLGAGLIRRAQPPTVEELQALNGFQLGVTLALALITAAVAAPFGEIGWVTALMVSSMPLAMLQLPGRILLERSLSYRSLAVVELSQVFVYNAWAISLVLLGFGVWGMASATVAMRLVAVLVIARVSPAGLIRPRFAWHLVRPQLAFGVRFQATSALWLVGQQGMNVSLAAIAGVSTLGLWSLVSRVMQIPGLLVQSLYRVSFPTMSQLMAAHEDTGPLVERAVGMIAVGSGIILTGLAGSAPGLIPGLFGEHWRAASSIMPGACLGAGISAAVAVSTQGYLYAVGDASAVLRSVAFQTVALFGVTLPLVSSIGVSAVGLGLFVSGVVGANVLRRAMLKWTSVDLIRPLVAPIAAGVASAATGWFVTESGGPDLVSGLVGGGCSVLLFLALLTVLRRKLVHETFRFAVTSVLSAVRSAPTHAA